MADITRDRIISAAQGILKTRGAEALTMETAAELAGVSRKTVYNYFQNRFELIDAAVARWMRHVLDGVEGIAADNSLPFIDKLNAIVDRGFRDLREGGRIFGRPHRELLDPNELDLRNSLQNSLENLIKSIVNSAAGEGYIREEFSPHQITWIIINIITGITVLEQVENQSFSKAELLQDSLKAVVLGVLSPAGLAAMRDSPLLMGQPAAKTMPEDEAKVLRPQGAPHYGS
ncbi:TetR/AcrR family transcriptional regulator [Gracilinema caldarium]|uniref:TetR/AcrR family transcriptional regulator n=1 Tax=Gracilinema caldarium TaxID=215591 RepID=UPI0026EC7D64|nr:TetR/AcrR family transcriptional regulator [Gracilinema caldarium]